MNKARESYRDIVKRYMRTEQRLARETDETAMLFEKGQARRKKIDAEIERLRQSAAQHAKNRHKKLAQSIKQLERDLLDELETKRANVLAWW